MVGIDLTRLSYMDLLVLKDQTSAEIEKRKADELECVKNKLQALAERSGFSLSEIFSVKHRMAASRIKYKNPQNPRQTWSGRGRRPHWLVEALEKGADLKDFSV